MQNYRPDIDGLRAIAILSVVMFHAQLGVPGGYTGVDVFFVISGFLITSIVLKELNEGRFSMAAFWERRARRIVPAASLMTIVVLGAGWFLLLPQDFETVGKSAMCQTLFSANHYFWKTISYFGGPAEEKMLLHTWSLAVEEQFYILMPLAFALWARWRQCLPANFFFVSLVAGTGMSFLLSCWLLKGHPSAAFYLLPSRAWELGMGACLAAAPSTWVIRSSIVREIFSCTGALLLAIPFFAFSKTTAFPGLAALPSCLGTGLLILSNSKPRQELTIFGRFLASKPMVFFGLISYSLYLWHWPIFSFSHYWSLAGPLSITHRIIAVIGAIAIAFLSWRFVETPFRTRNLCATRPAILKFAASLLVLTFGIGSLSVILSDSQVRLQPRILEYSNAGSDMRFVRNVATEDINEGRLIQLGNWNKTNDPSFIVWGDSHAMAILAAFDLAARRRGIAGCAATYSATPPAVGYTGTAQYGLHGEEALGFNDAVFRFIKRKKVPVVILAAMWSIHFNPAHDWTAGPPTNHVSNPAFTEALIRTVSQLREAGCEVFLLAEVPQHPGNVPRALSLSERLNIPTQRFAASLARHRQWTSQMQAIVPTLENAGAKIIDLSPLLFEPETQTFRLEKDGVPLYRDRGHLSTMGAESLADAVSSVLLSSDRP